jgi:HAD superfamily hydrolase (TIGR01509 family)
MAVKLVIFVLDGVLVETRDLHFRALNEALMECGVPPISREDHETRYNGLPTTKKLDLLLGYDGPLVHDRIWALKQRNTERAIAEIPRDERLIALRKALKDRGIKVVVASNSRGKTILAALERLGFEPDSYISASMVGKPKPAPDMYWRAMSWMNSAARDTLIIEDSEVGRQAAEASGAKVLMVKGPEEVTLERILEALGEREEDCCGFAGSNRCCRNYKTEEELNILIPMAGEGKRFKEAGYTFPKPLIEVNGKPMIQRVVESLGVKGHYVFISRYEDWSRYGLSHLFTQIARPFSAVHVGDTGGAADTALFAERYINNDSPLLIANSDQIIEWSPDETLRKFNKYDGGILTFDSTHPKWSYVRVDGYGCAIEVAEKRVVSGHATCGVYYWKRGSDFVKYAKQMIEANDRVNGEFFIAPVFNYAIRDGKRIVVEDAKKMIGLGDPESLEAYLRESRSSN